MSRDDADEQLADIVPITRALDYAESEKYQTALASAHQAVDAASSSIGLALLQLVSH
jgi:hypothetical protein